MKFNLKYSYQYLSNTFNSFVKMEPVCISETLVSTYDCTCRHNPQEHHDSHDRENFRSHHGAESFLKR
jgi:hypothetical protein